MLPSFRVVCASLSLAVAFSVESATAQAPTRNPSTARRAIVVGFVGGYVRRDNMMHNEVRLATQLRRDYPSDVIVLTFENHHGQKAHEEILRILDTDQDGKLSLEEKQNARIIIYGHSWGASETVNLARELEKDGIPVLLTIQVDSISKGGQNDAVIPANVAQAANFYQTEGLLHGREKIQPADPTRTHIVGNFRSDYKSHPVRCDGYPWFSRVFMKTHIEIECDPNVWNQVDLLIRSNLPASDGNGPSPRIETGNSPPAHSNRSN